MAIVEDRKLLASKKIILLTVEDCSPEDMKYIFSTFLAKKFDAVLESTKSINDIISGIEFLIIDITNKESLVWYSQQQNMLKDTIRILKYRHGTNIRDKMEKLKTTYNVNYVIKNLPDAILPKIEYIIRLFANHISSEKFWEKLLSCVAC